MYVLVNGAAITLIYTVAIITHGDNHRDVTDNPMFVHLRLLPLNVFLVKSKFVSSKFGLFTHVYLIHNNERYTRLTLCHSWFTNCEGTVKECI